MTIPDSVVKTLRDAIRPERLLDTARRRSPTAPPPTARTPS